MNTDNFQLQDYYGKFEDILTEEQKTRGILLHIFQHIQKEYNYLPEDILKKVSKRLGIPISEIYSVASFYKNFYFEPRGKNIVCVCTGTACHVKGSDKLLNRLEQEIGISKGQTTLDMSVTLETVACIGCCGLAPVVTINDIAFGDVLPEKIMELLEEIKKG